MTHDKPPYEILRSAWLHYILGRLLGTTALAGLYAVFAAQWGPHKLEILLLYVIAIAGFAGRSKNEWAQGVLEFAVSFLAPVLVTFEIVATISMALMGASWKPLIFRRDAVRAIEAKDGVYCVTAGSGDVYVVEPYNATTTQPGYRTQYRARKLGVEGPTKPLPPGSLGYAVMYMGDL